MVWQTKQQRQLNNGKSVNADDAIDAAKYYANGIKRNGTIYTVSLSLGEIDENTPASQAPEGTYTHLLGTLSSGDTYQYSANSMENLIDDFENISSGISNQTITTVTVDGIVYLGDQINVNENYVQNVVINIPNNDNVGEITLTWTEFKDYYEIKQTTDSTTGETKTEPTINITELARANGINGITGQVSITINVDI